MKLQKIKKNKAIQNETLYYDFINNLLLSKSTKYLRF